GGGSARAERSRARRDRSACGARGGARRHGGGGDFALRMKCGRGDRRQRVADTAALVFPTWPARFPLALPMLLPLRLPLPLPLPLRLPLPLLMPLPLPLPQPLPLPLPLCACPDLVDTGYQAARDIPVGLLCCRVPLRSNSIGLT